MVVPVSTGKSATRGVRGDIQGLRAVAVLAVVANHSVGFLSGGFLGVDVFFVISGFIITSLLMREIDRTGRISFVDFYKRRVKRILPAATLVLITTVTASYVLIGGERARQIAGDALAATFFVSNWRFAAVGADYWADDGTTSPLQHYWSLGVEEQFYIVWPLLIALVALILYRRRALKPVLAGVLIVIAGASFVWAALQVDTQPMWAYFSTLTRIWELAAGALIAIAATQLTRMPHAARPVLAWAGIVALAYALVTVQESDGMPVPGAVIAVLATGLIIAAGTGARDESTIWVLSNPVARYVGDISYALYLWHLPVIVFLAPYFAHHERKFFLVVLALTVLLSIGSYHLVENPIRRSEWLTKSSGRKSHVYTALASVVVLSVVTATSLAVFVAPPRAPAALASESSDEFASQQELTSALEAALAKDEWPALSPAPGDVSELGSPDEESQGCGRVRFDREDTCWFPNAGADRTALVLGDSIGITLMPTIREALGEDWNVRGATMAGCPQIPLQIEFSQEARTQLCPAHQQDAMAAVAEWKPDIIFVSNLYTYVRVLSTDTPPEDGGAVEWALGLRDLITELQQSTETVVVVESPPKGAALAECAAPGSSPASCVSGLEPEYRLIGEAERAAAVQTGATYVSVEDWYCVEGKCPAFVGNTPLKRDVVHTSKQYAQLLAPLLRARISDHLD